MLIKDPGRFPFRNWTDQGSKFRRDFIKFCDQNHNKNYQNCTESKSSPAEPSILTLITILYKIFQKCGSYKYIHFVWRIVKLLTSGTTWSKFMVPVKVKKGGQKNVADVNCWDSCTTLEDFSKNQFEKCKIPCWRWCSYVKHQKSVQ